VTMDPDVRFGHIRAMNTCPCGAANPSLIAFGAGVVMLRCQACDTTTWIQGGVVVDRETAAFALRDSLPRQRRHTSTTTASTGRWS
jgi:hypothetical protein